MSTVSSDDLTTDAMPSAPRADPENDVNIPRASIGDKPRTSHTSETKHIPHTGTLPPYKKIANLLHRYISAFGNVINITNSNVVHIGSNIVINPKPQNFEKDNVKRGMVTDEIRALFRNNRRVCRDDLIFVAQHIDDKWKKVGKALEHSDGELSAFEHDYERDGLTEV